jgi:hypothetical protein
MRAALLVAVVAGLALGGCRSDKELAGPDLSSASLFCPPDPPLTTEFICDRNSIPYCTYLTQQVTCTCLMDGDGFYRLHCMAIMSDGGAPAD